MNNEPSEKQYFMMEKLGIQYPQDVTKQEATQLISEKLGTTYTNKTGSIPVSSGEARSRNPYIQAQCALKAAVEIVCAGKNTVGGKELSVDDLTKHYFKLIDEVAK